MAIDREKVLQAAQKFVEKKKYDKAVLEYQKLIAEDPNDARTLLKIGDLQSKMEAYPDAISTYERVGKFYATQGFALKAIAVYKQIRELIAKHSPQLEERYGHITPKLAELYQQLGLTSDALAALDEVATRLQRQNKDNEAIEVFRKIVELDPTNPLPHLRLAEALSRIKDNDGAVAEFGLAASQLVRLGRRDDALKVIERLLHHKSDAAHARIAAELYLARNAQNDGMQALAKLQICFQANPKDLDTLALLARAFAAIGQAGKGIEVQKEMAKIAREQGKKELFKQLVEKLLRAAPNDEGVKQLVASSRDQGSATQAQPDRQSQERAQDRAQERPQAREAPPPQPAPPSSRKQAPPAAQFNQASQAAQGRNAPVDDLSYDSVVETADIDELAESEMEPFALRTDRPQPGRGQPSRQAPPPPPPAQARGQSQGRQAPPPPPPQPRGRPMREPSAPELSIAEDQLEVAEEYEGAEEAEELEAPDTNEQLAQVLADAASFRRVRLYPKAIETLRIGLEIEPRSLDLREFLRDVLIESGDHTEAVEEMLTLASLYVDSLDGDAAARALQDVLAYDPQNYRAREMLHELGYEVIDEPAAEPEEAQLEYAEEYAPSIPDQVAAPMPARGYDAYDNDAPLPSYDLEEIGPADVSNAYSDPRIPAARREPSARPITHARRGGDDLGEIDDPFGDANAPLPSFPLDQGPESEAAFDLVDRAEQEGRGDPRRSRAPSHAPQQHALTNALTNQSDEPFEDAPDPTAAHRRSSLMDERRAASERAPDHGGFDELDEPATDQVEIPAAVLNVPPTPELEEALEEADFFASRGLFEDARTILREQLERLPKHPLLRERLAELDSQEQAQKRGSGTREMPRDAMPGSARPEADRAFDIAASLDALEASDKASVAPGGFAQPEQQVDVEEVFAKFKEGVAKQISVDDAQSHYDLGVAYKEMGLVDDAVREFETAARDPKRECVCRSMIGMIQIERGNINEAIDALMRGLSAKVRTGEQEVVLMFEVGACYEQKKMGAKALEFYQKVLSKDPNYRDVQERVRRLSKSAPKGNAIRQAAVGADEEFDRAFDDLLSDGKS